MYARFMLFLPVQLLTVALLLNTSPAPNGAAPPNVGLALVGAALLFVVVFYLFIRIRPGSR